MSRAQLTSVRLKRFKSHEANSELPVRPLTVVVGRNNSGKSSLIQALLLLKQTLAHRRSEVPLRLEGIVDALGLRDLTWGWPAAESFLGPEIELRWDSDVDLKQALGEDPSSWPQLENLRKHSQIQWIEDQPGVVSLTTTLRVCFSSAGVTGISVRELELSSRREEIANPSFHYGGQGLVQTWGGCEIDSHALSVELDHFLPVLRLDRTEIGPRDRHRSYYHGFRILYEQPLEDLRRLLANFAYLSSARQQPPSIYKPASVPPTDLGVNGEEAARVLHGRQYDRVRYLPPLILEGGAPQIPPYVRAASPLDAVNDVMQALGVSQPLTLKDVQDVGFRLLFGSADIQHVGRGVAYLLPTVALGVLSDPMEAEASLSEELSLSDYLRKCQGFAHGAIEEAEIHLHPAVQSRLAHWLVSLGMAGRRFIVETHSDHLVRRLRGLVARAEPGSDLEDWLGENVVIADVEQDSRGASHVHCARLTREGGLEKWPEGFMDEATDEERAIYSARLEKTARSDASHYAKGTRFVRAEERGAD